MPWEQSDVAELRAFAGNNPRFIETLVERRPDIEGNTMEAKALTAAVAEGYETAVKEIQGMMGDVALDQQDAGFVNTSDDIPKS